MNTNSSVPNNLRSLALITLFISSYAPLFILLIARQVYNNRAFLKWENFNRETYLEFFQKFGLASLLLFFIVLGYIGYKITFANLAKSSANGDLVKLTDVKNKNSEAIGYIATYIIPFLFQDFNSWYEILSVLFLLWVIFRIYINSNMILVNPILSFKYALFEIEYEMKGKKCNGLAVSPIKNPGEDVTVKLYEIGPKLFYLTL